MLYPEFPPFPAVKLEFSIVTLLASISKKQPVQFTALITVPGVLIVVGPEYGVRVVPAGTPSFEPASG
jgi:hypothetical protein